MASVYHYASAPLFAHHLNAGHGDALGCAMKRWHLAQFNIAKMRHPRWSEDMAAYNNALEQVLPIALAWSGFLWIMGDDIIARTEAHFGSPNPELIT
jgi:hypothetical protein